MVEYMVIKNRTRLLIAVLLLATHIARADMLKDPTLSPIALDNNTNNDSNNASLPTEPVLQSVMLSKQYKAAIINGQKVMLGEKYEQATLIKISESSAVLRKQDGSLQTLRMDYAAIEKKNITPIEIMSPEKNKVTQKVRTKTNTQSK